MKRKLKLTSATDIREKGFTLPLIIGLGLIAILVGTTMMIRTQGEQTSVFLQKETANSLSVAETGITRTLAQIDRGSNNIYLSNNYDPIDPQSNKTFLGVDGIERSGDEETTQVDSWTNPSNPDVCTQTGTLPNTLLAGTVGSGTYQLLAYRYRESDRTGHLLIQGTKGKAVSRLAVAIEVEQNLIPNSFPGLYASYNINLGNNDILKVERENGTAASAICGNCQVTKNDCVNEEVPQETIKNKIQQGSNSQIDGNVYIANLNLPSPPPLPTNQCSAYNSPPCKIPIDLVSGNEQLPRQVDLDNRELWGHSEIEPYIYEIGNISLSSTDTLTLDSATAPLRLYVSGNITMSSGTSLIHDGTPERLSIFGTAISSQTFTLYGGSTPISTFIYAPNARVTIIGGSSNPDLLGALWVKQWDGSFSNQTEIRIPNSLSSSLAQQFNSPSYENVGIRRNSNSPPISWNRNEAN